MTQRKRDRRRLGRTVGHLLRHVEEPSSLKRDERGFLSLEALLAVMLNSGHCPPNLTRDELEDFLRQHSDRFEIEQDQVRARYGHSLPGYTPGAASIPPERLYHATSQRLLRSIQVEGLRPMGRRLVHLTSDLDYARMIAIGIEGDPLILRVDAERAGRQGARFWQANQHVWLTEGIAPEFLRVDAQALVGREARQRDERLARFLGDARAAERSRSLPWYHVCDACNAKWFAQQAHAPCPRCGRPHLSQEQRTPPWRGGERPPMRGPGRRPRASSPFGNRTNKGGQRRSSQISPFRNQH